MSKVGKEIIESIKEAIEMVVPPVNLDEIKRRYPPDISEEDFNRIIEAERENRAAWATKQAAKGKEE